MTPVVIALAGPIGSGKTSTGRSLITILGWPLVSFGDYVRQVAKHRGVDVSREALQDLGLQLIDGGWESFVRAVVAMAPEAACSGLIVDGIRHKAALDMLRAVVAPKRVWAGYLHVPDGVRRLRLTQRGDDHLDLDRAQAHTIERELDALAAFCDEQIDANRPIEEVARHIVRSLHHFQSRDS